MTLEGPLTTRLEGSLVTLEPLGREHADGLWEAARAPEIWQWLAHIERRLASRSSPAPRR